MARQLAVILEDQHGVVVRRLSCAEAAGMVARGAAFRLSGRVLKLRNRSDLGADVTLRSSAAITHRQVALAAEAWGGSRDARARYQAARIAVWPQIGDSRAVVAR